MVLVVVAAAPLLSGGTCDNSASPSLTATADRSPATGALRRLTVEGAGFTKNGAVRISFFFRTRPGGSMVSVTPPQAPARELKADANGKIQFVDSPVPCLRGEENVSGSWISVVGHDLGTGKSGIGEINPGPGQEPDCVLLDDN